MKITHLVPSLILCAAVVSPALAIPVFSENAAVNKGPITLFPDSNDPRLVYYFPNSSGFQVGEENKPIFGLTTWGLKGPMDQAGGWMSFTMRLQSDRRQDEALTKARSEGLRIAVLPVRESTVGISSTKGTGTAPFGRIFDELGFPPHGGFADDDIGVNATLTGVGAKVFRAALETVGLMKVDYCAKFDGLGPQFKGKVTIHWDQVYDNVQAHFKVGGLFHRVDVQAEFEKMLDERTVEISTEGGDATKKEYIKKVAELAVDKFFEPTLKMQPTDQGQSGGWSFMSYGLKVTHREQHKKQDYIWTERDLVTREICVPLSLNSLKPYLSDVLRDADLQ